MNDHSTSVCIFLQIFALWWQIKDPVQIGQRVLCWVHITSSLSPCYNTCAFLGIHWYTKLESRWTPFHCIHLLLCMYWATHLSNWVWNTEECAIRIHCLCTSKQLNEGLFGWKQQVGSAQLRLMVVVGDGWVVLYDLHKKLGYRLCDFMTWDEVHKPNIETPYHTQMCLMCKI